MNVAAPFIRRPVATTLLVFGLVIFGLFAYRQLPVSDLPNVDFPTISVRASLPGASPETMASAIAVPLERQFSTIAGLDSLSSSSTLGNTEITLQFSLERDIDSAAQDVQAEISRASRLLPKDMPSLPTFSKLNPADSPILFIGLTSETLEPSVLSEYGENRIAPQISTVSGVAQVRVLGAKKYAVRIQLDPRKLVARGIGIDEVTRALQAGNPNLPTGSLFGPTRAFTVQTGGQLREAAAFRELVVVWRNGAPVRLGELGEVSDSVENDRALSWFVHRGQVARSIMLAVQRQPGTNTVKVASAIRKLLPEVQRTLPASVAMHVLFDRSQSIRESVDDMQITLGITLALVVLVIFLFLRRVTATVIPSLALPTSLLGTLAGMHLLGYSLDNLSLMALALSTGFVVDDAIVMLENIHRHLEMGKSPWQAALDGSREVAFTIVSMTVSLAAVFLPVLFLGGLLGRLFHEFAVTIGLAVLLSGVVSLTLTPMLCSRFLRPPRRQPGAVFQATERLFDLALAAYRVLLTWTLRHRVITAGLLLLTFGGTAWLGWIMPKGFLPSEDTGAISIGTEGPEGVSHHAMIANTEKLTEVLRRNPNVEAFMANSGARGGSSGLNVGMFFLRLVPRAERELSSQEIVQQLRGQLAGVPGIRAFPSAPPPIRIGTRSTKSEYQFTLQGSETKVLYQAAGELERRLAAVPELQDMTSDLQLSNPTVEVAILRDRAARLGLTPEAIESALYDALGTRQVSTIYAADNTYAVLLELLPEHQQAPEQLSLLHLRSASGELVPLDAVVRITRGLGPQSVNHSGQLPSVTLSFNPRPGVSLGQATARVEALARETVPAELVTSFQGTAEAFQSSLEGLGWLLLLAIFVIYLVLGILYESFLHPITILSALPFAGFGALLTLWLFDVELSVYAFVGMIMLVGLVKKNGIMMVDFAITARTERGLSASDAIFEASLIRFRPIMMTTFAAIMGTLPIALGWGAGGEARQPLGLAVVGGLLFSQLITLFATPVVYVWLDRVQGLFSRHPGATVRVAGAVDAGAEAD